MVTQAWRCVAVAVVVVVSTWTSVSAQEDPDGEETLPLSGWKVTAVGGTPGRTIYSDPNTRLAVICTYYQPLQAVFHHASGGLNYYRLVGSGGAVEAEDATALFPIYVWTALPGLNLAGGSSEVYGASIEFRCLDNPHFGIATQMCAAWVGEGAWVGINPWGAKSGATVTYGQANNLFCGGGEGRWGQRAIRAFQNCTRIQYATDSEYRLDANGFFTQTTNGTAYQTFMDWQVVVYEPAGGVVDPGLLNWLQMPGEMPALDPLLIPDPDSLFMRNTLSTARDLMPMYSGPTGSTGRWQLPVSDVPYTPLNLAEPPGDPPSTAPVWEIPIDMGTWQSLIPGGGVGTNQTLLVDFAFYEESGVRAVVYGLFLSFVSLAGIARIYEEFRRY